MKICWIQRTLGVLLLGSAIAVGQSPLLEYSFDGRPGNGVTLNTGSFNPGAHGLIGHEESGVGPTGTACLLGAGNVGSEVATGYSTASLGNGSWTVGWCINTQANPSGSALEYHFGSPGGSWCVRVLSQIGSSPQPVFRGVSRGILGAIDPGPRVFSVGASGLGSPNGMIYDTPSLSGMNPGALTLTPVLGSPLGALGYDWNFF